MIQSMTGFGKAIAEQYNKKATVEIKALNSKQMDLSARLPSVFREKEMEIRSIVSQKLERGKVDLTITTENIGVGASPLVNVPLIGLYKSQIEALSQQMAVKPPADWFSVLLRLPDAIKTEIEGVSEEEWAIVRQALDEALDKLCAFRTQEGIMLANVLQQKIANIVDFLKQIEPYEKERIDKLKNRILDNIRNIPDVQIDANRLEQEMIFYIEKLDINEEKNRLDNHLKYFIETLNDSAQQGKKLGFIAQEIGREINTLGAKSNHFEMQQLVVRMKDELEQIKEQVQNVL